MVIRNLPPGARTSICLALLAATLLLAVLLPRAAWGQRRLATATLKLAGVPEQVLPTVWEGRPAAMIMAKPDAPAPGESPQPHLYVVRLERGELVALADWVLPLALRWVEPIARPDRSHAWFALIGHQWFLGEVAAGELRWFPLCACDSVFTSGRDALPAQSGFVRDLNGDGVDEVLLPERRGLTVYRQVPGERRLVALWQDRWNSQERYERTDGQTKVTIRLPRFSFADVDGNGVVDLIQIEEDHLLLTPHDWPAQDPANGYYFVDDETRADYADMKMPPELKAALGKLPPRNYQSPEAFTAALLAGQPEEQRRAWAEYLPAVIKLAQVPVPMRTGYVVPLPALGTKSKSEDWEILDVQDMNGDGVIDVMHHKGIDTSDIFAQKNQLRWFTGRLQDGRLVFDESPKIFFTEGPAFAQLVRTNIGPKTTPTLFLATMDVDLLAIIRAITLKKVSLDVFVYPWSGGKVVEPAPTQATLTFTVDFSNNRSRPMLLVADLDGDGWRDYLFNLQPDRLYAYRGTANGAAIKEGAFVSADVMLPRRAEEALAIDLDGKPGEELLFWYRDKRLNSEERRQVRAVWLTTEPAPAK